jgi:flagellar hook-associated protein 3 FlgL
MMILTQSRASARLDEASRIAAGAQRVSKPSDDPAAYGSMVRKNYAIALLDQHAEIASRAEGELDIAQNALTEGIDLISRAREAAVAGANTTADAHARKLLGDEVRTIREELMALANTRYANKYIFGGTRTDAAPIDTATGAFVGNDQTVRVPVLEGVAPAANISGAMAFTAAGGRDIFADLENLANALYSDNTAGIVAAVDPLDVGHRQIVRAQVDAGFGAERFRTAIDIIASTRTAIADQLHQEIEGDPAAQITEFTLARTAYERSVAVTKQLLSISTSS